MKRTLLLFVVLVLGVGGLRAQHFEWVKGYSSSQEGNRIVGQVTDSLGNLYILGQFRNTAAWDGGSHLLPMAPYGPVTDVSNVLIAKITPDGTMAWKKVIHCNNGSNSGGADIKKFGDTAFACLVHFSLPDDDRNYCYYLDTLLCTTNSSPVPHGNMTYNSCTALVVFDFEGHVLEQHFLTLTYLDNNGNDIMYPSANWYFNVAGLLNLSFDIDSNGNIFLCRIATDNAGPTYATWRGNVGGIKYWVDGRVVGQSEVRNSPQRWYPQLLKFSPHMDSLLGSRYLVQRCDTNIDYQTDNLYMRLSPNGTPYVIGTWSTNENCSNTIIIDSINNVFFYHLPTNPSKGFLIKTNENLQAIQCVALSDSITHPDRLNSHTRFHSIAFDEDSNLVFIAVSTARGFDTDTSIFYSTLICQNTPLQDLRNDAFVLIFSQQSDTLVYKTHGRVLSKIASSFVISQCQQENLVCEKNRIITQPLYVGGIMSPISGNTTFPSWGNMSLGLAILDYKGKVIDEIYYKTFSSTQNKTGPISLQDSILYLANNLVSDATFGDIHVPAQGYNACIAKYVDTAFMTPYVPPTVHIGQAEAIPLRLYPNPAHGAVRIDTGGEPVRSAALLTVYGQRTPLQVDSDRMELTGCPAGVYILEITTNNQKYHQKIIIL